MVRTINKTLDAYMSEYSVNERLASLDLHDGFYEALDRDDYRSARKILLKIHIPEDIIGEILRSISQGELPDYLD